MQANQLLHRMGIRLTDAGSIPTLRPLQTKHFCGIIARTKPYRLKIRLSFVNFNSAQPTASVNAQTLYGTSVFQVRLIALAAGETISSLSTPPSRQSQIFPIQGPLGVSDSTGTFQLEKGQRLHLIEGSVKTLQNQNAYPILLLEIRWGQQLETLSLPEVTEVRPWGSFTVLKDEPDYKLKQLTVQPGNRLSLQRHQKREEHWIVTRGFPSVTLDEQTVRLSPEDYIHIPRHSWHRISNPAETQPSEIVEIIELQLGDYFGEDDIERQQDDYGRS